MSNLVYSKFKYPTKDISPSITSVFGNSHKPFWKTANGEVLYMDEMKTSHLFYTFRMLYDGAAKKYEWPILRRYNGLESSPDWSDEFVIVNMFFLYQELMKRMRSEHIKPHWNRDLKFIINFLSQKFEVYQLERV
ncbi:hypothetical protein UFOVP434_101 [uncultured Caudovirales phage]|uniref:Uncharacterized protein n=1 Tax=uncultured Caudovirales phage TaxID=2100421 RepID=A0A6J5MHW1_9CAUD|nr:hypothetical protein UFOVP434_101 [uncultured Caudovirales phage]